MLLKTSISLRYATPVDGINYKIQKFMNEITVYPNRLEFISNLQLLAATLIFTKYLTECIQRLEALVEGLCMTRKQQ